MNKHCCQPMTYKIGLLRNFTKYRKFTPIENNKYPRFSIQLIGDGAPCTSSTGNYFGV